MDTEMNSYENATALTTSDQDIIFKSSLTWILNYRTRIEFYMTWLPLNVTITVVIPFQMIQLSIQLLRG